MSHTNEVSKQQFSKNTIPYILPSFSLFRREEEAQYDLTYSRKNKNKIFPHTSRRARHINYSIFFFSQIVSFHPCAGNVESPRKISNLLIGSTSREPCHLCANEKSADFSRSATGPRPCARSLAHATR